MKANLSIRIPIYNQPQKLLHCLQSIKEQTIQASEIILFDDNSSSDYSYVIEKYKEMPLLYIKNKRNLGAVPNMLNALYYSSKHEYILVFHEDDIMQKRFIEYSITALEKYPDTLFCCSNISFYNKINQIKEIEYYRGGINILDKQGFIKNILAGKTIGFGSIVYRTSKLKKIEFEFDKYSVLGDRPFLINLINDKKIIYINKDLSVVYDHSKDDDRWKNMNENHVLNLHLFYKRELSFSKNKEVKANLTHSVINIYKLIPNSNKNLKVFFYLKVWIHGVFSLKYFLLSFRFIRKIIEKVR